VCGLEFKLQSCQKKKDLKLKFPEENIKDIRFDNEFLDRTPKAQATKAKIRQMELHQA
jgi:hypothetical protein